MGGEAFYVVFHVFLDVLGGYLVDNAMVVVHQLEDGAVVAIEIEAVAARGQELLQAGEQEDGLAGFGVHVPEGAQAWAGVVLIIGEDVCGLGGQAAGAAHDGAKELLALLPAGLGAADGGFQLGIEGLLAGAVAGIQQGAGSGFEIAVVLQHRIDSAGAVAFEGLELGGGSEDGEEAFAVVVVATAFAVGSTGAEEDGLFAVPADDGPAVALEEGEDVGALVVIVQWAFAPAAGGDYGFGVLVKGCVFVEGKDGGNYCVALVWCEHRYVGYLALNKGIAGGGWGHYVAALAAGFYEAEDFYVGVGGALGFGCLAEGEAAVAVYGGAGAAVVEVVAAAFVVQNGGSFCSDKTEK